MAPKKLPVGGHGLPTKASGLSILLLSSLLCFSSTSALPNPRHSNSFRGYQQPEEELDLDLLVPDLSQQQIEGIEAMLDEQADQEQMIGLPSSWSSPDYQDYLDILPLLAGESPIVGLGLEDLVGQPRLSPFHKKDSEYLAFQADPSLTNRNLPKNPSITLRKTPAHSPTTTPATPLSTPRSSLSAERRGMKEQALFRPESEEPLFRGRRKRSAEQLNKISTPFLPSAAKLL